MAYAKFSDVESGFRELTEEEQTKCTALLEEAAVIIDAYGENADEGAKKLASCRMVRRVLGDGDSYPIGTSQGSTSAMGYSQSWTISGGSAGELYLSKLEKKMLGCGNHIGAHSPLEDL